MSQITANVRTTFELFEWSLPVLILVFGSDSKFSLLDLFHYALCDLSIETVLVGTTVYAIHFTEFEITFSAIPKPSAFFQNPNRNRYFHENK